MTRSSSTGATASSSSASQQALNNEELAVAAYLNSLRGTSIQDKFNLFDECAAGQSDYPELEQPTKLQQKSAAAYEIWQGSLGNAWFIITFTGDELAVDHFTHG